MGALTGRTAIVTGASRGIGAAIAERFAAEGASLVVTARTMTHHDHLSGSLVETLTRCRAHGATAEALLSDLADADDRAQIVPAALEILGGRIDVLVNNAAAGIHQPLSTYPLHRRRVMSEVNVNAPLDLAQTAIPVMQRQGEGWIVNLSSGSARQRAGPPFGTRVVANDVYGATKAALDRMMNGLAIELFGTGIRVNGLWPMAAVATEGAVAHLGDRLAAGAYAPVEVVVEACLALARCVPECTGATHGDRALLDSLRQRVMTLDGSREMAVPPRSG